MNFAWPTILVLLSLLPGFLFLVGIYASQYVSRDMAGWKTPGQITAVVASAFLIHAIWFLGTNSLSIYLGFPDYGFSEFVAKLLALKSDVNSFTTDGVSQGVKVLGNMVILYVVFTSVMGFYAGKLLSRLVKNNAYFRFLVKHQWVYSLIDSVKKGYSRAYVLTKIEQNGEILIYEGIVEHFYIGPDGQISYLLLNEVTKYYTCSAAGDDETSREVREARKIGPAKDQLFIEGEDIANVIFSKRAIRETPEDKKTRKQLRKLAMSKEEFEKYRAERRRLKSEGPGET